MNEKSYPGKSVVVSTMRKLAPRGTFRSLVPAPKRCLSDRIRSYNGGWQIDERTLVVSAWHAAKTGTGAALRRARWGPLVRVEGRAVLR